MRQHSTKKIMTFFHIIWLSLFFTQAVWAQQETLPVKIDFNELKLREKIATRISAGNSPKNPAYSGFNADKVVIEKLIPFQFQGQTFFGVRLKILPIIPEQTHEFLYLFVDRDINYQFSDIIRIDTGVSEFNPLMVELRRFDLPATGIGQEIFQGSGAHQITFVSDPFCPYCRQVWGYIDQNRSKLKSLKLAHYPIHSTSQIACAVMMFAQKNRLNVLDIVNFSYTRLNSSESPVDILNQYASEFPDLKKLWGADLQKTAEKLQTEYSPMVAKEHTEIRDLGIMGTPITFVDGYMIEGFNVPKFNELIK